MKIQSYIIHHLIKQEDLNHHGTLYAGRTADWFVESGFVAAASLTRPERIVCLKIHGMTFTRPVRQGEIIRFESKIILAGRTKLIAYVESSVRDETVVRGFITFIHVDQEGHPLPHGIILEVETPLDIELHEAARRLPET